MRPARMVAIQVNKAMTLICISSPTLWNPSPNA